MPRVIFHVDVNSAFLSWSAAYRVRVLGEQEDLRENYGEGVIRRARFTGADTVLAGGLARERRTGITKPLDAE